MEDLKTKIKDAFGKINLDDVFTFTKHCLTCGKLISDEEYSEGQESCFECWSK